MIQRIKKALAKKRFNIGFIRDYDPLKNHDPEIGWLNLCGYKQGWFADPFLFSVREDTIQVLAEEFVYKTGLGRLVLLTIDAKEYKLIDVTVILELPTHLSYPIFLKGDNGEIYIYPENYQSGALSLYRFDVDSAKLCNPVVLIDEPLLDTQIEKIGNSYYAFAIKYVTGRLDDSKKLHIYKAENLYGPWSHIQTIHNDKCEERGAGMIFRKDGSLFRPCQNCEGDYGKSVILKTLTIGEDGLFYQSEVERIEPRRGSRYGEGLHTYNTLAGLTVIDGVGYSSFVTRIIKSL